MKITSKIIALSLATLSLGAGSMTLNVLDLNTVHAQSLSAKSIVDAAIRDGKIGETTAGYLAAVNGQALDAATAAAMREVNIGRKAVYTRLARDQGVKTETIAALTGEKQIASAARGTYVLTATGWQRK